MKLFFQVQKKFENHCNNNNKKKKIICDVSQYFSN